VFGVSLLQGCLRRVGVFVVSGWRVLAGLGGRRVTTVPAVGVWPVCRRLPGAGGGLRR
jgi:hypothetical protein